MSTKPLAQKLFIKKGNRVLFVNATNGFIEKLGKLLKEVEILDEPEDNLDFIQLFAKNKEELETLLPKLKNYLNLQGKLWLSYYKGTSKIKTDINRDTINEYGQSLGLKGVAMISIDDDWSALRFNIIA